MNFKIAILTEKNETYEILSRYLLQWQQESFNNVEICGFQDKRNLTQMGDINKYDIIFSEMEMDGKRKKGVEIGIFLREKEFKGEIIFWTCHGEYALDGYKACAFDYVLKSMGEDGIKECMEKYVRFHQGEYYCFRKGNHTTKIPYRDIVCIGKEGHDAVIQTCDGIHIQRISLSQLQRNLSAEFLRCHKSVIVNLRHIRLIDGDSLYLSNGLVQRMGRNYVKDIRRGFAVGE